MGESSEKKHCQPLMKSFKDDPDVKYLANNIRTRAEVVNNMRKKEGFSIGFLKEVTTFVSYMNRQAASAILGCKQDLSTSNKSFTRVVSEYLKNSEQLLDFCSALDKFVKSARDSHSYTQFVVQQYIEKKLETDKMETEYCLKILEKLKKLKSSEDIHVHSAESLLRKIKSLITQFEALCKNLEHEIAKIDEEKKVIGSQKKLTSCVYKSIAGLVCTIVVGFDLLDLADVASGLAEVASNFADGTSGVGDAALGASDIATDHPYIETASEYIVKAGFITTVALPITAVGHSSLIDVLL